MSTTIRTRPFEEVIDHSDPFAPPDEIIRHPTPAMSHTAKLPPPPSGPFCATTAQALFARAVTSAFEAAHHPSKPALDAYRRLLARMKRPRITIDPTLHPHPTHPRTMTTTPTDTPPQQLDPAISSSYRQFLQAAIDTGELDASTDIDYLISLLRQCPPPPPLRPQPDHRHHALLHRLTALYHSMMSSAASAREDAALAADAGDTTTAEAETTRAAAYETSAGWLKHIPALRLS